MTQKNEMVEKVARAMMRTVFDFDDMDCDTASLDCTGNELWGCDFALMAIAAIEELEMTQTQGEWQPIENYIEIPNHENSVLITNRDYHSFIHSHLNYDNLWEDWDYENYGEPTHFMEVKELRV